MVRLAAAGVQCFPVLRAGGLGRDAGAEQVESFRTMHRAPRWRRPGRIQRWHRDTNVGTFPGRAAASTPRRHSAGEELWIKLPIALRATARSVIGRSSFRPRIRCGGSTPCAHAWPKLASNTLVTFNPSNIAYVCGHFSTNLHDFQCLVVSQTRPPLMVLWYFELARFHASAVGAIGRGLRYGRGSGRVSGRGSAAAHCGRPSASASTRARLQSHRG